ncbi:hypothetical protein ACTG9Q_05890 [Actinokineospora sp. 24-640]
MTSTHGWQGDSANGTADKVRHEGRAVAQTTAEEGKGVAREARAQGQAVVDQAKGEARKVAQDAKSQLRDQAEEQTKKVGESLRRLGEHVDALAQGRPEEAGPLTDYVRQAADKIHEVVGRVESRGFEGIVQDAESFARRRPGTFLLVAAAAGFSASRLLRAGSEARKEESQSGVSASGAPATDELTAQYSHQAAAPPMPVSTMPEVETPLYQGGPQYQGGSPYQDGPPYQGGPQYQEGSPYQGGPQYQGGSPYQGGARS